MKFPFLALVMCFLTLSVASAREVKKQIDPKLLRAFGIKIRDAQAAFQKNDLAAARKAADEADTLIPGTFEVPNVQGAIFYKEKKYPEALEIYRALLARDPTSFAAYFNTGEVLFMAGNLAEAQATFMHILESNPGNEACQYRIVLILALQGKFDEARAYAKQIAHPGQTAAYYFANAAVEYVAKNPDKGDDWLKQSETLYPPNTSTDLRGVLVEHGLLKK